MQCAVCGTELERAGQGHTCRPAEPLAITPPTTWVAGTWALAGFSVLYAVMALLVGEVTSGAAETGVADSGQAARVAAVTLGWLAVLVGTVVAQVMWNRSTRRLAEQYGFDGKLVIRTLFVRVYGATILVSVLLQPLLGLSDHASIVFVTAIRVLAGLVLLANVLIGRARLMRLIADSARQSREARDRPPAPAPGPAPAPPSEDDLDKLWGRVGLE